MIWSFQWISFPPASQYTLVTLERIKKRWEDGGAYFLVHVANKPKPKKVVPQNKKYFRNAVALKDSSKLLRQMSFLALIFTGFLTKFQEEGPFIHMLFHELQRMLSSLMLRFFKAELVNWKALLDILIWRMKATNCPMNLCMLEWMLKHCWRSAARILGNYQKEMQDAFMKIATYFQSRLLLNNSFLKDMIYLHPLQRNKMSANPFWRIAKRMPHVILSRNILSIVYEWSVLRADDDIEDWYLNQDDTFKKRLDHYWSKVFSLKTLSGSPKYPLLSIAVKCYGNVAVERSLYENKNTLTKERASLGEENSHST